MEGKARDLGLGEWGWGVPGPGQDTSSHAASGALVTAGLCSGGGGPAAPGPGPRLCRSLAGRGGPAGAGGPALGAGLCEGGPDTGAGVAGPWGRPPRGHRGTPHRPLWKKSFCPRFVGQPVHCNGGLLPPQAPSSRLLRSGTRLSPAVLMRTPVSLSLVAPRMRPPALSAPRYLIERIIETERGVRAPGRGVWRLPEGLVPCRWGRHAGAEGPPRCGPPGLCSAARPWAPAPSHFIPEKGPCTPPTARDAPQRAHPRSVPRGASGTATKPARSRGARPCEGAAPPPSATRFAAAGAHTPVPGAARALCPALRAVEQPRALGTSWGQGCAGRRGPAQACAGGRACGGTWAGPRGLG